MEEFEKVLNSQKEELLTIFQNKTDRMSEGTAHIKFKILGNVRPLFIDTLNSLFGDCWAIEPGSHYTLYLYVQKHTNGILKHGGEGII